VGAIFQWEIAMKSHISIALAAAVLLSGVSAASAASATDHQSKMSKSPSSQSSMSKADKSSSAMAKDSLRLTSAQRKTAWNDISGSGSVSAQTAPKGFSAKVGATLPSSLTTQPVPTKTASDVPALRPYDFAMLQKKILIVNPSDKKIAEVITK
jgi:hypothetical protein